ncbi:MAG TPA: NAD(P) transhydrogenase subunit alpha [Nitrospirota bacterium]|nr:NAD(P) transhydrogenase subunit alpha [Nitrospirota bacterium]
MPLVIGVPRETGHGEKRVAIVPDVVKKFKSLGVDLCIERGAGTGSFISDNDFGAVSIAPTNVEVFARSQVILKVQPPTLEEIRLMQPAIILIGFLNPYQDKERAKLLCEKNITSFAVELIPRISRAQSMDALSSQATVAGYQCALIAGVISPKFFPMLTYAAGTLRPTRVMVIGAGVAGLQAIATAHRLGAIVEAYDVRPETREQIESLGARFIDTGVTAVGSGGYARELTHDERTAQQEKLAKAISQADVLITTAAIPGKKSPLIVTDDMVGRMKKGAVIVDMAAEGGGNVAGSRPGETVDKDGVSIVGTINLASRMPVHASEMYARNLFNFISPFIKEGTLALDWSDEVLAGSVFTHEGSIRNEGVKNILEGAKS